jgi:hypothetical protein
MRSTWPNLVTEDRARQLMIAVPSSFMSSLSSPEAAACDVKFIVIPVPRAPLEFFSARS